MNKFNWQLSFSFSLGILFFLIFALQPAFGEELSAKEVMVKVEERETGDTRIQNMTMILIDRKGKQRIRQIKNFSKEYGKDSKTISFFLSPADVKNTVFLSYDWDDENKEDDSWLYLPALRKIKKDCVFR